MGGGGTLQGGESKVSRKVAVQLRLQNGEPKASSLLHGGNGWSPEGSTARAASWQSLSSLSCCTAWSTCQQGALPTAWRSAPLHVAELRPWWRRREWNPRGAPSKLPGACSSLLLLGCQELPSRGGWRMTGRQRCTQTNGMHTYTWSGSWVPFTHIQPTTRRILPYFIDYWWITCY